MFFSRKVLSFGLRMTLARMQENIISLQNIRNPAFITPNQKFSLSSKILEEVHQKPPIDKEENLSEEIRKQKLGEIEGKLQLLFTCKKCNTRNKKIISNHAYKKGVVIARCDGCLNNHLIADNLGWFVGNGSRNIEQILKKKGENVRRIRDDDAGYFEAITKEEIDRIQNLMKAQEKPNENVKLVEEIEEVVKLKYEEVGQPEKS